MLEATRPFRCWGNATMRLLHWSWNRPMFHLDLRMGRDVVLCHAALAQPHPTAWLLIS